METNLLSAFSRNFLGVSPKWYKNVILAFLVLNPILLATMGPTVTGWAIIFEFIFTLAMALKCYPLQPGGLLAIEAVVIGLTTSDSVYHELEANIEVVLLLVFMVAGIHFMKDVLLYIFSNILTKVRSKVVLSLLFSALAAFLSAFLDALTVTAVLISIAVGFYNIFNNVQDHPNYKKDESAREKHRKELEQFRSFLRSLIMHGAVGTALGGVMTMVGEPQNLVIASKMGWGFIEFIEVMAPVTFPVFFAGLLTVVFLEKTKLFGYGAEMPESVRELLIKTNEEKIANQTNSDKMKLIVQGIVGILLIASLALHVAAVGLIGLMIIVLLTAFNGVIEEHQIGHAFEEALPFTALLVVFFTVVSVIHEQHLFTPITDYVLAMEMSLQPIFFYAANGILSAISDNVFVASVYINEVMNAFNSGAIDREHLEKLAIAINTGTNLPSVATPNGQAAFLFLLTSALAPLIRLSYGKMVLMALPYTIVLSTVGALALNIYVS